MLIVIEINGRDMIGKDVRYDGVKIGYISSVDNKGTLTVAIDNDTAFELFKKNKNMSIEVR